MGLGLMPGQGLGSSQANRNTEPRVRAGSQLGFYDRVNLNFQEANCLCILASLCCCFDQLRQRDFWHLPSDSTGALPGPGPRPPPTSFPSSTLSFPTLLIHFEKYFPAACVWRTLGAPVVAVRGRFSTYFLCFLRLSSQNVLYVPRLMCIGFQCLASLLIFIQYILLVVSGDVHLIGCSIACTVPARLFVIPVCERHIKHQIRLCDLI